MHYTIYIYGYHAVYQVYFLCFVKRIISSLYFLKIVQERKRYTLNKTIPGNYVSIAKRLKSEQ